MNTLRLLLVSAASPPPPSPPCPPGVVTGTVCRPGSSLSAVRCAGHAWLPFPEACPVPTSPVSAASQGSDLPGSQLCSEETPGTRSPETGGGGAILGTHSRGQALEVTGPSLIPPRWERAAENCVQCHSWVTALSGLPPPSAFLNLLCCPQLVDFLRQRGKWSVLEGGLNSRKGRGGLGTPANPAGTSSLLLTLSHRSPET